MLFEDNIFLLVLSLNQKIKLIQNENSFFYLICRLTTPELVKYWGYPVGKQLFLDLYLK